MVQRRDRTEKTGEEEVKIRQIRLRIANIQRKPSGNPAKTKADVQFTAHGKSSVLKILKMNDEFANVRPLKLPAVQNFRQSLAFRIQHRLSDIHRIHQRFLRLRTGSGIIWKIRPVTMNVYSQKDIEGPQIKRNGCGKTP